MDVGQDQWASKCLMPSEPWPGKDLLLVDNKDKNTFLLFSPIEPPKKNVSLPAVVLTTKESPHEQIYRSEAKCE